MDFFKKRIRQYQEKKLDEILSKIQFHQYMKKQAEQKLEGITDNETTQTASMIQNMFESMSGVEGELTFVNEKNYVAIFKLHSGKDLMEVVP